MREPVQYSTSCSVSQNALRLLKTRFQVDVHTRFVYTTFMIKNITFSADEALIEQARRRAMADNTTLNDLFKVRYRSIRVRDVGKVYNTDLLEARELGYLIDNAEAMATSALARTESRGAHSRDDFPERDDAGWLKHTLAYRDEAGPTLRYKPVTVTRFEPKPRTY